MAGLRSFVFFNEISQKDLAEYLGVSKGYMSKLVSGSAKLKPEQLAKLLNNDKGWNTEFLIDDTWSRIDSGEFADDEEAPSCNEIAALRKEVEMLREQNKKLESINKEYWEMIKGLTSK